MALRPLEVDSGSKHDVPWLRDWLKSTGSTDLELGDAQKLLSISDHDSGLMLHCNSFKAFVFIKTGVHKILNELLGAEPYPGAYYVYSVKKKPQLAISDDEELSCIYWLGDCYYQDTLASLPTAHPARLKWAKFITPADTRKFKPK